MFFKWKTVFFIEKHCLSAIISVFRFITHLACHMQLRVDNQLLKKIFPLYLRNYFTTLVVVLLAVYGLTKNNRYPQLVSKQQASWIYQLVGMFCGYVVSYPPDKVQWKSNYLLMPLYVEEDWSLRQRSESLRLIGSLMLGAAFNLVTSVGLQ